MQQGQDDRGRGDRLRSVAQPDHTNNDGHRQPSTETGQTIVLIVFLIIGLLAFTGLAVDAGFVFARSSQFSAAVDAAALAAVVEMDPTSPTLVEADARARQFLAANGWPTATLTFSSTSSLTAQGFPQYSLTVTWPVETFFMGIIGFDLVDVTQSATAVHVAQAELYLPTYFENGQIRKAAQFIMGPDSCTSHGDPISSEQAASAGTPNTDPLHFSEDGYLYRIMVPVETYTATNTLRVELFDPDSANNYATGGTVHYSNYYAGRSGISQEAAARNCATQSIVGGGSGQACVFRVEDTTTLQRFNQNPLWFVRVDENFASDCSAITDNASGSTVTEYELYYLDGDGDEVQIAAYTASDPGTDLRWVTPSGFEFDISPIPVVDEARYIYLRVRTTAGSSKNVWDLWAGPPSTAAALALHDVNGDGVKNVNDRNLLLANYPASYPTYGVQIYALGRMPLQHFTTEDVTIPLVPVPSSLSEGTVYASIFDYEGSIPLIFTIDTVSTNTFYEEVIVFNTPPEPDPLATGPREVTCGGDTNCNADWTSPQLRLGVPSTYFFGGTLFVKSLNPQADAHTWSASATAGRPFLSR